MAESAEVKASSGGILSFWSDARDELRKVTRPTKQEITQAAIGTIVIIITLSVILSLFDVVFNQLTAFFLS
jgi:preprotein translocase SecE subunit